MALMATQRKDARVDLLSHFTVAKLWPLKNKKRLFPKEYLNYCR